MTPRPPPGPQLAAGRVRVDAARAIAKLREYQLVDRTAWVLEAIRAAVAASATSIELSGDANDVHLAWAGEPLAPEDLPKLFDDLVSPEADAARHHIRLLAAAVNSALGMNPAYVDVIAIGAQQAQRVRYTPDVLDTPGDFDDAPLRRLTVETADAPAGAVRGMHIHLRRRASFEVMGYFLRGGQPPELALASHACSDISTPLTIGELVLDRHKLGSDILRLPLEHDLDGFVAVVDSWSSRNPRGSQAVMTVAERGVQLSALAVDLLGLAKPRSTVPLRVLIDAPRMPTNASRSEVRIDAHPVTTALRRAQEITPRLIDLLVKRLVAEPGDQRARDAAVSLLASVIAGDDWSEAARRLTGPLRKLAELPLLRDATGVRRATISRWRDMVHSDDKPLSSELSPWCSDVLWVAPDDVPSRKLLSRPPNPDAMKEYLWWARRELRAQRKFFAHAQRPARVESRRVPWVRAALGAALPGSCVDQRVFDGCTGEVCIYGDAVGGELVVLFSGRELDRLKFDSPIGFEAVIESPLVRPLDRYRRVARDDDYLTVEAAMRAGVLRAVEAYAVAATGTVVPVGYDVNPAVQPAQINRLVLHALTLARSAGVTADSPLAAVPVWQALDGSLLTLAELRAHPVVGFVPPGTDGSPPAGRPVVVADEADRRLLTSLLPSVWFVEYERHMVSLELQPANIAAQMRMTSSSVLGIRDQEVIGAIAPASKSTLVIRHRGVDLIEVPYQPTIVSGCAIVVDSDAVVPARGWIGASDDAGLSTRDFSHWERSLVRAAARALVDDKPAGLLLAAPVTLDEPLGMLLCDAIARAADPVQLLGEDLVSALRTWPLVRLHGADRAHSIDEVALMFPATIPFVDGKADPVDGFMPVIGDRRLVVAIGLLARRDVIDGTAALEAKRTAFVRSLNFAEHRAKPAQPLALPGESVQLVSELARGVVGVATEGFELQILVDGRPFHVERRPAEPPLRAIVDVGTEHTTPRFDSVRAEIVDKLVELVCECVPALLEMIAGTRPAVLVEPGPELALFAAWAARAALPTPTRERLRERISFPTIQGERVTLPVLLRTGPVAMAAWHGTWLAPADGQPRHELDRPTLYVPAFSTELTTVLDALHDAAAVDVTEAFSKLQSQRQMERGMLPIPRVDAPAELTRPLLELGAIGRELGPGEIALTGETSRVLVHVRGVRTHAIEIDVAPSIDIAIEAPDLAGAIDPVLESKIRSLAVDLARQVLDSGTPLPVRVRRSLRAALILGELAGTPFDASRVFPVANANGNWIDWRRVQEQITTFGNLWCLPEPRTVMPLDERRLVLVLDKLEMVLAKERGLAVLDAKAELQQDAIARTNRDRPRAYTLDTGRQGVMAAITLDGDGLTAPRGLVAVLAPSAADRRGVRAHREMQPFDLVGDPCRWPTLAVIDDARLAPDRTWQYPMNGPAWQDVITQIRNASETALREVTRPPSRAISSIVITPLSYDGLRSLPAHNRGQIRGHLWLDGPPCTTAPGAIQVVHASGTTAMTPLQQLGIAGQLYMHGIATALYHVVEELCSELYGRLVRQLFLDKAIDPDLVTAHAAWALSLDRITASDAKDIRFTCFRPHPLNAFELRSLFASGKPVAVEGSTRDPSAVRLVDDGSATLRVIRTVLGLRLRGELQPATPAPAPIRTHPWQPFISRVDERIRDLGVAVPGWCIVDDRKTPVVAYANDQVELAGLNPTISLLAAAWLARSATAGDGVDLLAAHIMTVLNDELTHVTDATEAQAVLKLLA